MLESEPEWEEKKIVCANVRANVEEKEGKKEGWMGTGAEVE